MISFPPIDAISHYQKHYGLYVSPTYLQELQTSAATAILPRPGAMVVEQWHMIAMAAGLLAASGALTLLINALAGR